MLFTNDHFDHAFKFYIKPYHKPFKSNLKHKNFKIPNLKLL
jgi:hypothetical protein